MNTDTIIFKLIASAICITTLNLDILFHKAVFIVYMQSEKTDCCLLAL